MVAHCIPYFNFVIMNNEVIIPRHVIFVRVIILVGAGNLVRNSATVEAVVRVIIVIMFLKTFCPGCLY